VENDIEFPEHFRKVLVCANPPANHAPVEVARPLKRGRRSDHRKSISLKEEVEAEYDPYDISAPIPKNYDVLARWKTDGLFRM
jgi:hypothetical protein